MQISIDISGALEIQIRYICKFDDILTSITPDKDLKTYFY